MNFKGYVSASPLREVIKQSVCVHSFVSSPYVLSSISASECVCWCGARVCFVCMCTYPPPPLCLSSGPIPSSSPFYPDLAPMCPPCPNPFPGRKVLIEGAGFSLWPVGVHYCVFISKRGLPD